MAQNSDKRNSTYELLKRDETTTVQSSTSINRLSSLLPIQIQKSSPRPRESPLPTTLPSPRLGGSQLRNWRSGRCNGKKGDESWRQKKCGQGKRIERGDVGREVKRRGEKNCLNKLPPPPLISRQLTCCSVDEGCIDEHERKKWERKKKKKEDAKTSNKRTNNATLDVNVTVPFEKFYFRLEKKFSKRRKLEKRTLDHASNLAPLLAPWDWRNRHALLCWLIMVDSSICQWKGKMEFTVLNTIRRYREIDFWGRVKIAFGVHPVSIFGSWVS